MIHFYRDVLDGPLYVITAIISLLSVMAILGFIMERLATIDKELSDIKNQTTNNHNSGKKLLISSTRLEKFNKKESKVVKIANIPDSNLNTHTDSIEVGVTVGLAEEKIESGNTSSPSTKVINQQQLIDDEIGIRKPVDGEAGVLSINSADINVKEMEETKEIDVKNMTGKVTNMTRIIDFGSIEDIDIDKM